MALPPGITPKTVTVGIGTFFDGTVANGTATITAPVNVIHVPTGRPIYSSTMTKPIVDGEVSFDLCPTDAPGLNRVDWTYKLTLSIAGADSQPFPVYFPLTTAGPDTVDLDTLVSVPSSAGTPVSVDVPRLSGPNIWTGTQDFTGATVTGIAGGGTGYTDEQVRDVMGAALRAGSNVTITPNDAGDTITIAATGSGAASITEADYVISISGSTVSATARTDSGLAAIASGNDAYAVIQAAITNLTASGGGVGSAGGRIHITRGVYMLSNELTITGWENTVNPVSQLAISGDGHNTQLIQNTAGKNGLVVKNSASFALRDLRIYSGVNAKSALLLDKTGANLEQSTMSSVIDNVSFESDSTSSPAGYLINFFDLTVTAARFMNSGNHGLVLENDSTGTSYGNSHFGFLRCAGSNAAPYAGLKITTTNGAQWMNMLSFSNYECIQGYYGIYGYAAWNSTFDFVDIESTVTHCIYLTGDANNYGTRNIWFKAGYLWPNAGGSGITCTAYAAGCTFDLYIETTGNTNPPVVDQNSGGPPNYYDLTLNNASAPGYISIANRAKTPLRIRNFADSTTSDSHSPDAKIIVHGASAGATRPATSLPVIWFGSVQPTNMADGDVYVPVTAG